MILDDAILDHPKFVRAARKAGSAAIHLWLGLMSYSKQQRTDGVVPVDILPVVHGPVQRWRQRALEALVEVELVERVGAGELRLHDFLDWNKSREEIELESAARSARRGKRKTVGVRTDRRPTDDAPIAEREPTDDGVTTHRRQPVSSNPADLKPQNPPLLSYPNLSDPDPPLTPQDTPSNDTQADASKASTRSPRSGRAPKARASICPDDLKPDTTTASTAWQLGFSDTQLAEELAGMKDWSRSKSARRDDWQATLRNWLRKSARERGLAPRKPRDAKYEAHQEALRKANAPPSDPVKLPKNFGGSLFG